MPEASAVRTLFSTIAPRYDLANRLLSFGLDGLWRRQLVRAVQAQGPLRVVDLATGTGDVAFALREGLGVGVEIVGLDFCPQMLAQAQAKQASRPPSERLQFQVGDCLQLPFADQSIDAFTMAFGLRNLADRGQCFREIHRSLRRPSGMAFVLEFSQPEGLLRPFYRIYLKHILPVLGGMLTGRPQAYRYLRDTIDAFPAPPYIAAEAETAGLVCRRIQPLSGGIVTLYHLQRI